VRLRIEVDDPGFVEKEQPSGAKAHTDSGALMYGLKPVPFTLKPVPFTPKLAPFIPKIAPFNAQPVATLRNWRAGDRVQLRHSSGPRKVKEVLERLRVTGSSRAQWPVLEVEGRIVWMRGVDVEPVPGIRIEIISLEEE
jgi:tRNA(Ile)-lysidine synthase